MPSYLLADFIRQCRIFDSWLLLIYAKSAVDSIPGHILKALKEEMENATR